MPPDPPFKYVESWFLNRAVIEMGGERYTLVHRAWGILGPRFYVAMKDGRDVTRPYKRISPLLRALAKLKKAEAPHVEF